MMQLKQSHQSSQMMARQLLLVDIGLDAVTSGAVYLAAAAAAAASVSHCMRS
jgi:hypothetical protein